MKTQRLAPAKGTLLIVTYYFAPKNEIASVRIVNFAAGLRELGWDVDVVTVGPNPFNPLERHLDLHCPEEQLRGIRVIEVDPPWEAKALYWARGAVSPLLRGAASAVSQWRDRTEPRGRARRGSAAAEPGPNPPHPAVTPWAPLRRALDAVLDGAYRRVFVKASGLSAEYDAIWPTYGPRVMVDVGLDMARRFPGAAFVMDVRDPLVGRSSLDARERSAQVAREMRLARSRVDALSVVSEPCVDHPSAFSAPIVEIPNGFEVRLTSRHNRVQKDARTPLTVYYGGRLYPAQDVRPLAAACRLVSRSRAIRVEYAGRDGADFAAAFESQGVGHLVADLGMLTRSESLERARAADVVAVLSWNTAARGILTGKVFELIAIDTPIAVVVAGDYATSALAQLFSGDPVRRVFGDSLDPEAVSDLADFIRHARDIPDGVRLAFSGASRYREYAHPVLARRLSRCIEEAVSRRKAGRPGAPRYAAAIGPADPRVR